jgi:GNAT superfamily N-acetyltransferase
VALIAEAVRREAEDDVVSGPEPPAELNMERLLTPTYGLLLTEVPSWNIVQRLRIGGGDVESTAAEVRGLVRARGRSQAAWCVGPSSPADLVERLLELGMTPYSEPPYEAHTSCMALVRPPAVGALEDVHVERAETLAVLEAAEAIAAEAFGMSDDQRRAIRAGLKTRLRLQQQGRPWAWQYLASIDGVPVGTARARPLDASINLAGAGVLPSARGRGVYRALVAARWREALTRGTPALTVQAGAMSRPILERLGFATVAEVNILCDRFSSSSPGSVRNLR